MLLLISVSIISLLLPITHMIDNTISRSIVRVPADNTNSSYSIADTDTNSITSMTDTDIVIQIFCLHYGLPCISTSNTASDTIRSCENILSATILILAQYYQLILMVMLMVITILTRILIRPEAW